MTPDRRGVIARNTLIWLASDATEGVDWKPIRGQTSAPDHSVHRSPRQLERAIRDHIKTVNEQPKPFRSTKSAPDILASIKRFCLATLRTADTQAKIIKTSGSGH